MKVSTATKPFLGCKDPAGVDQFLGIHTGHDPVRDPCVHQSGGSDRQGHTRLTRPAQDSRRAEAGGKYEQKLLAQRT